MELSALMEAVRAGDESAARQLHAQLEPELLGYIRRRVGIGLRSRLDPEDVFQETFSEILLALRNTDGPIRHPDRFAKTVARRILYRVAQRRSLGFQSLDPAPATGETSRGGVQPAAASTDPPVRMIREERNLLSREALSCLTPQQARIVRLRLEGEPKPKFTEIGDTVGMSAEAAERAYLRAIAKMRQYLRHHPNSPTEWRR